VVGADPPGNLGSMINWIRKGIYFNVGKGRSKRSMVFAKDVAGVILKASKFGGIYNLTDGYHPSYAELSEVISTQLGKGKPKSIPIIIAMCLAILGEITGGIVPFNCNKLKKMTSTLTFDDSKARLILGWKPKPVLKYFKL